MVSAGPVRSPRKSIALVAANVITLAPDTVTASANVRVALAATPAVLRSFARVTGSLPKCCSVPPSSTRVPVPSVPFNVTVVAPWTVTNELMVPSMSTDVILIANSSVPHRPVIRLT